MPSRPAASASRGALNGAFVVLGVSGGIAAYKAVEICRRLVDGGAHVVPVLTEGAMRFVGAATFSALASEPAESELFDGPHPIPHTRLGQAADLVLVAPATATALAAYAHGSATDLLSATLLATRAPVVVCPAMHTEMWEHPAVQANLALLRERGVIVVGPESGRLAGGDTGAGRLAEPATIVAEAARVLGERGGRRGPLSGSRVLVTAGGTREPIDAVRVLANRSSGRQGHALAEVALVLGAEVTLVTAAELDCPAGAQVVHVETAAELAEAVYRHAERADVVVMTAAVADFRPVQAIAAKLSKADGIPTITLEATEDVLAELGRRRRDGQVLVGFAAEVGPGGLERARQKLIDKGADLLVVNDVAAPGVGFGHETNAVTILDRFGGQLDVPLAPKPTIAAAVLDAVVAFRARHDHGDRGGAGS